MIHEVGLELQAKLRAYGYPAVVVDGPEPTATTTWGRERLVLEHDEKDAFKPTPTTNKNPKVRMIVDQGWKLTIFAQSPRAGAMPFEHRRRAEQIRDLVCVAMGDVAGARKNRWTPTNGGFVTPENLQPSEQMGGAAYALSFTFERGVAVRNWAGDAAPEAALENMSSTTNVTLANGPDDQVVETGCGGGG